MKLYFLPTILFTILLSGCAGGKTVRLSNESGLIQTCDVSSYSALFTGSSARDASLNKCINQLQNAGYKVIDSKSNFWHSEEKNL